MIDFTLTAAEVRVLGALMEKEMTTPEYYPLSLNALVNACNQKSNRNPVVEYDEQTVTEALNGLKADQLVWQSDAARVPKYAHHLSKTLNLVPRESAVLCVLLLRGPQSPGELRGRTERMYAFRDPQEVAETLENLAEMGLAVQLPRQPGQREARFAHLLAGEGETAAGREFMPETSEPQGKSRTERIAALEEEVRELRAELAELKQEFHSFTRQFE